MLTLAEVAKGAGVSETRVRQLCLDGRLSGAQKIGSRERGLWLVPESTAQTFIRGEGFRRWGMGPYAGRKPARRDEAAPSEEHQEHQVEG